MKRCLGSGNTGVNINSTVMNKAVSLMLSTTEEHRLTLQDILLHLLGDFDTMQGNTITGILTLKGWNIHILYMNTPLLTILIHEVGQHLIIEGLHAINANTIVIIFKDCRLLNGHNLVSQWLADNIRDMTLNPVWIAVGINNTVFVNREIHHVNMPPDVFNRLEGNLTLTIVIRSIDGNPFNNLTKVITLSLHLASNPGDTVITVLGSIAKHALHRKFLPILFKWSIRNQVSTIHPVSFLIYFFYS